MPKIVDGYPIVFGLSFTDVQYFTEENDHNPWVIPKCSHCIMGRVRGEYRDPNSSSGHLVCEYCNGTGYAHPPVPVKMFSDTHEESVVACNSVGHLRCPHCGVGFKFYDRRAFSGKRHTCGHKLILNTSACLTRCTVR